MRRFYRRRDACTAGLAVEEVFAKSESAPTNTTIMTVIDWFARPILPEFADIAVVLCRYLTAFVANIGSILWRATQHT